MPDFGARLDRRDVLLALALAIPSLVQVLVLLPIASPAVGVLVALGWTLPVAWRRRHPVPAALLASACWLIPTDGYLVVGYVAAFSLYYSVGAHIADSRRVLVAAGAGLALGIVSAIVRQEEVGEYVSVVFVVVLSVAVGRAIRDHREQAWRLIELTRHLEIERERTAHAAVSEERARIARELHDVVSHGISMIAIQADAAEAALDGDAEVARRSLASIRGSARESLAEMRRLLGVLREEGQAAETAPLPGLQQLPALVERAREAGLPVTLTVEGEPRPAPASIDLSAYRIVQESLTNARKHARCADTSVALRWHGDTLRIEVRDQGPGADGIVRAGTGIVGMRERARLHGGRLEAESAAEGGFRVTAVLPLPEQEP